MLSSEMLFRALHVLGAALHGAVGQPGFLSIDCGLDGANGYKDEQNEIFYVPDGSYVDSGENHQVSTEFESTIWRRYVQLRSFPSGLRNCYSLPTDPGVKYLVRLEFYYGNYDGKNSWSTLQFDLYLGVNYWDTVHANARQTYEAIFVAWASWAPVCLVNTDQGTPFVSIVELRPLADALLYPAMANQSLYMYGRNSMGAGSSITRYREDPYDRVWGQADGNPMWVNLSTASNVTANPNIVVPSPVIRTAVAGSNTTMMLNITWQDSTASEYMVFLHFADFQNSHLRQFNMSFNDQYYVDNYNTKYLQATTIWTSWSRAATGIYNITLVATNASVLPPMLNAYEIYTLISHKNPRTFPKDFDTIMAIKQEYGIKKNWMGDPCIPTEFAWEGVKCRKASGNTTRIVFLDLSNSNLHGAISNNFTLLTALEYLNLSCNQLNGKVPEPLGKNNGGSFVFSFDMCNETKVLSPSRNRVNRTSILAISVVVPVMVIAVLVLAYFIWIKTRNPNDNPHHRQSEDENAPANRAHHGGALDKVDNRRFTYKELEKITNKFEQFIGHGGFGLVYYGRLENGAEVAVKMRSESSSHGLDQFFAEVQNLSKVHHRNLVSLVGYCWEEDHLALVYEYMARGSLCDHLRGNSGAVETLNWGARVQVVLDAAQGLDYLHKGCSLPIIHRDVKTSNILLDQNLQAKIADFGLSKTYLSDTQSHISITAAGTTGYIDPEYYRTGRLTESSDVYSFGVVLLEVVTGETPVLPEQGNIVQRVKNKITTGNIRMIADVRLGGAYEVSSMWKVLETALQCTADAAAQRPTMAVVVMQLKESLAIEKTRANIGSMAGTVSETSVSMSTFGPSAR